MSGSPAGIDLRGALYFGEVRSFLRRSHALGLATFLAVLYALGSMLYGGMLTLAPLRGGTSIEILTGSGTGQGWWNYPGLLVVAPWGIVALPFVATLAMIAVAIGVGLGMAVAVLLIVRLLRPTPQEVARSKAVGAITGLTPAMISLVTLGSCCTTTAVATGGIGLIAQASGSSTSSLLLNNWYLGVAQVAVVWAALFGQELLLTVYGGLLGLGGDRGSRGRVVAPPADRRWALGATLRAALAVGGLLWSLSMFAEWTVHDPLTAGAGWWFRWIVEHQVVAGFALAAAFFPEGARQFAVALHRGWGRVGGVVIAGAALSLLLWWPEPLASAGLDSLGGEILGALGAPTAWGAIPVGAVGGPALLARWGLEYVLTAGFALAAVVRPEIVFRPLLATVARFERPALDTTDSGAATASRTPRSAAAVELRVAGSAGPETP